MNYEITWKKIIATTRNLLAEPGPKKFGVSAPTFSKWIKDPEKDIAPEPKQVKAVSKLLCDFVGELKEGTLRNSKDFKNDKLGELKLGDVLALFWAIEVNTHGNEKFTQPKPLLTQIATASSSRSGVRVRANVIDAVDWLLFSVTTLIGKLNSSLLQSHNKAVSQEQMEEISKKLIKLNSDIKRKYEESIVQAVDKLIECYENFEKEKKAMLGDLNEIQATDPLIVETKKKLEISIRELPSPLAWLGMEETELRRVRCLQKIGEHVGSNSDESTKGKTPPKKKTKK